MATNLNIQNSPFQITKGTPTDLYVADKTNNELTLIDTPDSALVFEIAILNPDKVNIGGHNTFTANINTQKIFTGDYLSFKAIKNSADPNNVYFTTGSEQATTDNVVLNDTLPTASSGDAEYAVWALSLNSTTTNTAFTGQLQINPNSKNSVSFLNNNPDTAIYYNTPYLLQSVGQLVGKSKLRYVVAKDTDEKNPNLGFADIPNNDILLVTFLNANDPSSWIITNPPRPPKKGFTVGLDKFIEYFLIGLLIFIVIIVIVVFLAILFFKLI